MLTALLAPLLFWNTGIQYIDKLQRKFTENLRRRRRHQKIKVFPSFRYTVTIRNKGCAIGAALFRLHNPPFVNIIFCISATVSLILSNYFCICMKFLFHPTTKKAPSWKGSVYIRTCQKEAKPSIVYSFFCLNMCDSHRYYSRCQL